MFPAQRIHLSESANEALMEFYGYVTELRSATGIPVKVNNHTTFHFLAAESDFKNCVVASD
jgi:hypothetical protein